MRKIFYFLLVMMAALPVVAQGQERTRAPKISFEENQDSKTIIVEGDGMLNVQVMRDQECDMNCVYVVDEAQVEGRYEYTITRSMDDAFNGEVIATAQEPGKLISETVTASFMMKSYFVLPQPEITFTEDADGVRIDVTEGVSVLEVYISINGEMVETAYESFSYSYYVERTYEVQEITVDAKNMGMSHGDIWQGRVEHYLLNARELPLTPAPEIIVEEHDEYLIVSAVGDGEVHLYLNGLEESNPYYAYRYDDDYTCEFSAYCQAEGMNPSEWTSLTVVVPARVLEQTSAPSMYYEVEPETGYIKVGVVETEPSDLYYRIAAVNDYYEMNYTDWMMYDCEFMITEPGNYQIESYAVAPGKLESSHVVLVFTCFPVIEQPYDFVEDEVYYKIIDDNKVSVYASDKDVVVIPATVAHDGVTYMVTAIGEGAFINQAGLTEVSLGAYVTTIGDNAFLNCTSLTSVTLGDYVINVGEKAFAGCTSLATVNLGSGLARIGKKAFAGCSALSNISCKAATPPVMAGSDSFDCYDRATLHVYPAVADSYQEAEGWRMFVNAVGEDKVSPDTGDANADGVFNISDVIQLINRLSN